MTILFVSRSTRFLRLFPAMEAYGTLGSLAFRRTGYPAVGGLTNAVAFAWRLGVRFPLVAA